MEHLMKELPEINVEDISLEPMTRFPGTEHSSWIRYTIIEKAKLQSLLENDKEEITNES